MRLIGAILLSLAAAFAQISVRGTNEGTNEYKVSPLRTEPRVAWETKTGYRDSGAIVSAASVFVTGNTNGRGGVFGYDATTGRRLWSIPRHMRGEPATDGTAAYAVNDADSNQFRLIKIDPKSGRVLWAVQEEDLGNHDAAPLVADGRVFLSSRNGKLSAFDAGTGKVLWELAGTQVCSPSLAYGEGELYFSGGVKGSADKLTALDPATGKALWSTSAKSDNRPVCTSAVVASSGIVVATAEHEVFAFDAKSGAQVWKQTVARTENGRTARPALHELTLTEGVVYTSMKFGIVGWKLGTGQQVFEFAGRHVADSRSLRMAACGGVLYFLGNAELPPEKDLRGGWIYALDLATKQILWKHHASKPDQYNPDGTWSTQFVVPVNGGLVYENQGVLAKLTQ
ncbi:MAG: PQQ-binding-like beta-propeller repeat protein [Acidobacteriota bacterium]